MASLIEMEGRGTNEEICATESMTTVCDWLWNIRKRGAWGAGQRVAPLGEKTKREERFLT